MTASAALDARAAAVCDALETAALRAWATRRWRRASGAADHAALRVVAGHGQHENSTVEPDHDGGR